MVANILETRKEVVHIVHPADADNGEATEIDKVLRGQDHFIEEPLVARVVQLHKAYIASK